MRKAIATAFILLVSARPGLAEDCGEKLSRLLVEWLEPRAPASAMMTVETKGQPTTKNEFLHLDWDRYMVKTIEPAGGPWYLTLDGTTWQSADAGKTWVKAYSFDKDDTRAKGNEITRQQAGTVENAVCGGEELDGVMHETIEADMTNTTNMVFHIHSKYWINPDNGFVTRTTTRMTSDNFDSFTTQDWTPAPDLALPSPE